MFERAPSAPALHISKRPTTNAVESTQAAALPLHSKAYTHNAGAPNMACVATASFLAPALPDSSSCVPCSASELPALPCTSPGSAFEEASPFCTVGRPCEAQPLTNCNTNPRRWFAVLTDLQSISPSEPHKISELLAESLQLVKCDDQWSCSGLAELLARAIDFAARGHTEAAKRQAVGLLDFHKMVEKYRQVVERTLSSSSSGESGEEAFFSFGVGGMTRHTWIRHHLLPLRPRGQRCSGPIGLGAAAQVIGACLAICGAQWRRWFRGKHTYVCVWNPRKRAQRLFFGRQL